MLRASFVKVRRGPREREKGTPSFLVAAKSYPSKFDFSRGDWK